MSLYRIQGAAEKRQGIYYEFDSDDEPLGIGGMGKVYKGRCVNEKSGMSRDVAIKFMYSDLPPYAIEKARREAAIHFRHDNLIEMLGFIETEDRSALGEVQRHYHVVSELLEGVSLDNLFQGKLTDQQGRFVPFAEKLFKDYQQDVNHFAVDLIKNILSGLISMHDAGYIHRDIDPTNIMITSDGHIKLIDFGIAKKKNLLTTNDKHLTQAGQFIGKPEYAAPELVLGAIDEQNQTTDIYAVGILLFQCIVGHVPFEGDRSDVLQKQLHNKLPLKLIRHKGIREIISKATEKSRAKRYQSAAEFRVDLERLDLAHGGYSWKPMYTYIAGGAAACLLSFVVYANIADDKSEGQMPENMNSYDSAITMLHSGYVEEGLATLERLSQKGDGKATYILSRLYFKSKLPDDFCVDSILKLQKKSGVSYDNNKAHRLLLDAVSQDPKNYYALYELACDFWKADQRTEAVSERNGEIAENYFRKAYSYAKEANDSRYVGMIGDYLQKIEEWKANLEEINSER